MRKVSAKPCRHLSWLRLPVYARLYESESMEEFLPLRKMQHLAEPLRGEFALARPFPHIVIDDFFDTAVLDRILSEFPSVREINWQKYDNAREMKLESSREADIPAFTRSFLYHLNSATFLDFLQDVTQIDALISDPRFNGGGLHQIMRGGKLAVHADFSKHATFGLDRRLNLLLYLNKDWKEEYGGHLELWDSDMSACQKRILPVFNRVVLFSTTDFTYHGHPDPLTCPDGWSRKSLALYYFTNGRPADEAADAHTTIFLNRPNEKFKSSARQLIRDMVPPIVVNAWKKMRR